LNSASGLSEPEAIGAYAYAPAGSGKLKAQVSKLKAESSKQ
jgi:hypothetical protein